MLTASNQKLLNADFQSQQRSDQIFAKSLKISKICHLGLLLHPELLPAPVTDSLPLLGNAAHSLV